MFEALFPRFHLAEVASSAAMCLGPGSAAPGLEDEAFGRVENNAAAHPYKAAAPYTFACLASRVDVSVVAAAAKELKLAVVVASEDLVEKADNKQPAQADQTSFVVNTDDH